MKEKQLGFISIPGDTSGTLIHSEMTEMFTTESDRSIFWHFCEYWKLVSNWLRKLNHVYIMHFLFYLMTIKEEELPRNS